MRRTVSFTVQVLPLEVGRAFLGPEPDGPLVEASEAARFEMFASPTGLQRIAIRDRSYAILGTATGDPSSGLRQYAAIQGRIESLNQRIASAGMNAVRGDRPPQEVPAAEVEAWYMAPVETWSTARQAVAGFEQERKELAETLDEVDFQARWEVLVIQVPGPYRQLCDAPLEPVRAQALQMAYYQAIQENLDTSGKAPPSGS